MLSNIVISELKATAELRNSDSNSTAWPQKEHSINHFNDKNQNNPWTFNFVPKLQLCYSNIMECWNGSAVGIANHTLKPDLFWAVNRNKVQPSVRVSIDLMLWSTRNTTAPLWTNTWLTLCTATVIRGMYVFDWEGCWLWNGLAANLVWIALQE